MRQAIPPDRGSGSLAPALAGPVDDARLLYLDGDYDAAMEVLLPAAEAGDANAQNMSSPTLMTRATGSKLIA